MSMDNANGNVIIEQAGGFWNGPNAGPPRFTPITATPAMAGLSEQTAESYVMNGLKVGPLWRYCPNPGAYHCPGDTRTSSIGVGKLGWGYDSYSKTQNTGGDSFGNYWRAGATYFKLSTIANSSMTFIFMEDSDSGNTPFNNGTWVQTWVPGNPSKIIVTDPPVMYHGNVSTCAMADSHVESHKWTNPNLIIAGQKEAKGIHAPYPPNVTSGNDYQYIYDHYRHPSWN